MNKHDFEYFPIIQKKKEPANLFVDSYESKEELEKNMSIASAKKFLKNYDLDSIISEDQLLKGIDVLGVTNSSRFLSRLVGKRFCFYKKIVPNGYLDDDIFYDIKVFKICRKNSKSNKLVYFIDSNSYEINDTN